MDQPTQGPEKRFKKVLGLGNLRRLPELGPAKFTVFDMPAVVEPTPEAVAVACDTLFLDRLAASTSRAVTQVSSDTDALLVDLQQKVPMAVYGVRQQQSATDKVLEDQEGSLSDTIKALEACLQHCSAGEGSPWFTQDTAHAIERMLEDTDALPSISCLLSLGCSDAMDRVRTAYEVTPGVDVVRSTVSHNRWLQRSKLNHVSIAVGNCAGGPVCGIPTIGVRCRVEGDTSGWRLVSFSVPNNIISIGLVLTDDCADTAVLDVDILGVGIRVPLHAGPSKKSEDESLLQLMAAEYELSSYSAFFDVEDAGSNFWRDVAQLVEEYKSELCSPTVTAEVLRIVSGCRAPVNLTLCDTVLPIVWEALQAHSDHDYLVVNAFRTVAALSNESSIGADAVVTSAGGMNLMQSRMRAHVESVEVQKQACNALCVIAQAASPASKAVNASDARQRHY